MIVFTFTDTYVLAQIVKAIAGLRVDEEPRPTGWTFRVHDERGYALVD